MPVAVATSWRASRVLLLLASLLLVSIHPDTGIMAEAFSSTANPKGNTNGKGKALAVATWGFGRIAVDKARETIERGGSALDAVEAGVNAVELDNQDQYYVGYGGFPNAEGVMELDAAVMEGTRRTYGAVAGLQGCVRAVSVARKVMERSPHSVLVGQGASAFAREQGFALEEVLSPEARAEWARWKEEQQAKATKAEAEAGTEKGEGQHDTIGLIVRDAEGNLAAGTSTSGWRFKHPGRVGDSPLIGSGLYAESRVGAAVATGDGEEIMRVCLAFLVVEQLRAGLPVAEACRVGIRRLKECFAQSHPPTSFSSTFSLGKGKEGGVSPQPLMHEKLTVAVLAVDAAGNVGAASTLGTHNVHRDRPAFPFVVWREGEGEPVVEEADDGGTE